MLPGQQVLFDLMTICGNGRCSRGLAAAGTGKSQDRGQWAGRCTAHPQVPFEVGVGHEGHRPGGIQGFSVGNHRPEQGGQDRP